MTAEPPTSETSPGRPLGRVDLVGAGPGDPGLITVLGSSCLARAEAVVYDHLVSPKLLELAPAGASRIFAGKTAGRCSMIQDEINALLVSLAREGKRVVRLKGGDPYVFGRGAEEAEYLRASGVPFGIVPGVTAAVGVSAYAGIPITHRDSASAVAFVTGHDRPGSERSRVDWEALAAFPGTLAVYMGVGRLAAIRDALIAGGKPASTPSAVIQNGTLPGQRTATAPLSEIAEVVERQGIGPPALLVVGDVVDRRPALSWFEARPLFGRTVVVTRPEGEAGDSGRDLEILGAEVILAPMVAIREVADPGPTDHAIGRIGSFDWVVFTSAHGVRHFLDRLPVMGKDLRALGPIKIAAIGPATAEALASYRLKADLVPEVHRSEGLVEALKDRATGASILLARADRGRSVLPEELRKFAEVEQVTVYRHEDAVSLPSGLVERIEEGSVHWITATSPAIIARLHDQLSKQARTRVGREAKLATISGLTTEAAKQKGWEVAAEAEGATWEGLVLAILDREARGNRAI